MTPPFSSINPATGETVWTGYAVGPSDIDAAITSARRAFESWSGTSLDDRIQLLHRFAEQIKQHRTDLIDVICRETGKPRWEAGTEVDSMPNKIPISIDAFHERRKPTEKSSAGVVSATRYKPFGVVAVFGPFNFPGHLPNGHIVPALLAGNTVVFKPSELAPLVAQITVDCWRRAGAPEGVINLVQGGRETGQLLTTHPGINGIFFTGSFEAGRAINQALAAQPGKILALELGGNNPLVVHDVRDLDAAAYLTIQSAFISAGQRCSCARRLIVTDGNEAFIERLVDWIGRIRVGPYTDNPEPFMGPVITDAAAKRILLAQDELKRRGGRCLVETSSMGPRAAMLRPGLIDVTQVADRPDEEIFGPLLQLIRVRDFDAAIEEANCTRFGLVAGLLCGDRARWDEFHRRIRAGVVNWNRATTGASSALPFGGVGCSGNNRPSAYFAADYCSYPVATTETPALTIPASLATGIDLEPQMNADGRR